MAFPVILVDSATGSDSQASGAGPATALHGTANASTDGAGTTVTLPAGTDLSGVSTTGSDVIYLADATAGARNFSKITGKAGSGGATPTVTVANAFGAGLSGKTWAIGGKRASVMGTDSFKLFDNNSAAGDAMPGWVVEMQSGHSETGLTATLTFRRAGDTTDGPIVLRGAAGAAVRPILSWSADTVQIKFNADHCQLRDFDDTRSTDGSGGSFAIYYSALSCVAEGMRVGSASNATRRAIYMSSGYDFSVVRNCEIINGYFTGVEHAGSANGVRIEYNHIRSGCSTAGVYVVDGIGCLIDGNVIDGVGGDGIQIENPTTQFRNPTSITGNTIYNCGGDGIKHAATGARLTCIRLQNNILVNNTGFGLNFSDATVTDFAVKASSVVVANNNTYSNTAGAYHSNTGTYAYNTCPWATGDAGLNPTFANTSGHDFTPTNTSLADKAYPTTLLGSVANYAYPGAVQPQCTGGGGGGGGASCFIFGG